MDAIDNLIYSARNACIYPSSFISNPIAPEFEDVQLIEPSSTFPPGGGTTIPGGQYPSHFNGQTRIISYSEPTRTRFVTLDNTRYIQDAIQKHWFDVANRISYTTIIGESDTSGSNFPMFDPAQTVQQAFIKFNTPPYHLIFSYLVENTRIVQIFERVISMYTHDEKLTKTNGNVEAFRWIANTESIFYTNSNGDTRRNLNSQLRPSSEAIRRNAYQRLFGIDLAFGDSGNKPFPYTKADFNNSSFISLFESFLIEFWRGITNANNTSGQDTTDTEHLEAIARNIQETLMSRRTTEEGFANYRYFNLSSEEYTSYIFLYWLFHIISVDSPVVNFLSCNAITAGDRLINIGRRVGLPAHTKSVAMLDIAQPMNLILRAAELGIFNNAAFLQRLIRCLSTVNPIPSPTPQEIDMHNNLLLVINNWEKATGHRIKNPESNISGVVRLQQNGVKLQPALN